MASSPELAGRRVLVIEDESAVSMMLEDNLEEIGCDIAGIAFRFDDALEKAKSLEFDVAIVDINLAGRMTFPIAESLAARGASFVFSTGYGTQTLPARFSTTPVLEKPFVQEDLRRVLLAALKSH